MFSFQFKKILSSPPGQSYLPYQLLVFLGLNMLIKGWPNQYFYEVTEHQSGLSEEHVGVNIDE